MRKNPNEEYPACPKCGETKNVVKNGYATGKRRYRCTDCPHDFIPKEIKNTRIPKFEFLDLKILCILLYYFGYNTKDIFEYIIKPQNTGIINHKIIYQWIKNNLGINFSNFKFKHNSEKINFINNQTEFDSKIGSIKKYGKVNSNIIILSLSSGYNNMTLWQQESPIKTYYLMDTHYDVCEKISIPKKENIDLNQQLCLYLLSDFINIINLADNIKKKILEKTELTLNINDLKIHTTDNKLHFNYQYDNYFKTVSIEKYGSLDLLLDKLKWEKGTIHFLISFDDNFRSIKIESLARK